MKCLSEKELQNIRAEIRGGLLKRWEREAGVIWNVFSCLHPAERLFAEIRELERDCEWVLALPEGDEDLREWETRRTAVAQLCARRIV